MNKYKSVKLIIVSLLLVVFMKSREIINADKNETVEKYNVIETLRPNQAGTYFIKSGIRDEAGNIIDDISRLHIKYPKTILNYDKEEGMDAHDIVVLKDTFENKKESDLIQLGNAKLWSMDTGKSSNNFSARILDSPKNSGSLNQVEYYTNNTSLKVNVFEQETLSLNLQEVYMNQFSVINRPLEVVSLLVLTVSIIPLLVFALVFVYLSKKNREIKMILSNKEV